MFAVEVRQQGGELSDDWLNNGSASLANALPPEWKVRLQIVFECRALTLRSLSRIDLLGSKVFALCDRGIGPARLHRPCPDAGGTDEIAPWIEQQDGNPDWPTHVRDILADLKGRLGRGL